MTTKKFADEIRKKTKGIHNIMIEKMFADYVLYKNGKRIGVLFDNKLLLVSTENIRKLLPDAVLETSFDWGYYKLLHIEHVENTELLEQAIRTTYHDLYFYQELVWDISSHFQSESRYPDVVKKIYELCIPFLRFCYDKELLKLNPLDKQDRILHMHFVKNDLTEKGTKIFEELLGKWLVYTGEYDDKFAIRIANIKMLEKYYSKISSETIK